jgi:hypothetical protein
MKLIIALAAAGLVSSLTAIIPANAQVQRKDPTCIEKCHRAGGERGIVPRVSQPALHSNSDQQI